MSRLSRRALAIYAADQLQAGQSAKVIAKQLVAAMTDSKLSAETDYLLGDVTAELESRKALSFARISSARPLDEEVRRALVAQLKKATGTSKVLLDEMIDQDLIGGLRVETATRVWDSTIARKLQLLKEAQ